MVLVKGSKVTTTDTPDLVKSFVAKFLDLYVDFHSYYASAITYGESDRFVKVRRHVVARRVKELVECLNELLKDANVGLNYVAFPPTSDSDVESVAYVESRRRLASELLEYAASTDNLSFNGLVEYVAYAVDPNSLRDANGVAHVLAELLSPVNTDIPSWVRSIAEYLDVEVEDKTDAEVAEEVTERIVSNERELEHMAKKQELLSKLP